MGIKYVYEGNHWDFAAAFFKNADEMLFDPKAETSGDRYGYDVGGRNKEINQFNGQLFYKGVQCTTEDRLHPQSSVNSITSSQKAKALTLHLPSIMNFFGKGSA